MVNIWLDGIAITAVEIMPHEIRLRIALIVAAIAVVTAVIDVCLHAVAASGRRVRKAQPVPQAHRGCKAYLAQQARKVQQVRKASQEQQALRAP